MKETLNQTRKFLFVFCMKGLNLQQHFRWTTMILRLLIACFLLFSGSSFAQITPTYDDILIPMTDGQNLEADVYVPSGCVSCEAILVQTPYNKDNFENGLPLGIGTNLDSQPYAWVIIDWRGFYGSAPAAVAQPDRGQDGSDVCDWIVAQSWHGNRIGTWGPSALGNIQYQLMAKQHPNHTCAVPMVSDPSTSYDAYFYGGVLEEARLQQLDALGYGLSPIVLANPYFNNTWQFAANATHYADDIIIPTLQIGGWYDHNIAGMMELYKQTRNEAAVAVQDEQWLLIGPWVHGGTGIAFVGSSVQGELTYPNAALVNNDMAWDFFNYYLLDSVNNWQNTPKITYYELGNNAWHTSNADDIAVPQTDILYLGYANELTAAPSVGFTSFDSDPSNPTPTIGGATLHPTLDQGPYDQNSLDARSDIAIFETGDLTQDVSVTGTILLNLYVSSSQPDCDIAVRLTDDYPTGESMLITDGIKRLRFRNGYTQADEAFMTPGTVYPVQIELPFTNYTWKSGHKIKLYFSGNNAIRWDVNLQDGGTMYTNGTGISGSITIHHDATHPSHIVLPGNNDFLGINDASDLEFVDVYPNPSSALLYFTSDNVSHFDLTDLSGKVVLSGIPTSGGISVKELANGTYLIRLKTINGNTVEKTFVKN